MKRKVWVVRQGDGSTVAEIVRRAGETHDAVDEGRVFIGRKRVTHGEEPVKPGDEIGFGPKQVAPDVEVLFDEGGLVACIKPVGIPTVPDEGGAAHSLVQIVAKKIDARDLRVTSRLDRDVSGVVLFARDADTEDRLKAARARGAYRRRYVAIAKTGGSPALSADPRNSQQWTAEIGRGHDPKRRAALGSDAKPAETRYRVVALASAPGNEAALLAVDPITGRTHQIRVHASHAGLPLFGDRDYGGPSRLTLADGRTIAFARVALHAARVSVLGRDVRAPIPSELRDLWTALGGTDEAWDTAVACDFAS